MHQDSDHSGIFDLKKILSEQPPALPPLDLPSPAPAPARHRARLGLLAACAASLLFGAGVALALTAAPRPSSPLRLVTSEAPIEPALRHPHVAVIARATEPSVLAVPPLVEPAPAVVPRPRLRVRPRPPAAPVVAEATAPVAPPASSWATGSSDTRGALERSIDDLLDEAVGPVPSTDPRPTTAVTLPNSPTRRQVATTLRALEGEVSQCGEGTATVRMVVHGPTGRVTDVSASASEAGAARCVEDVVLTARFPRFEQERFVVAFPYRL